jgi:hypothetical protein
MSSWLEVKQQAQGWITQCFDSCLFEPIFCYSRFAPFLVLGLFANALYRNALNLHDEGLQTMCFMSRRHSMEVAMMSGEGRSYLAKAAQYAFHVVNSMRAQLQVSRLA